MMTGGALKTADPEFTTVQKVARSRGLQGKELRADNITPAQRSSAAKVVAKS